MSACLDCRRLEGLVGFARNDLGDVRRKLRRAYASTAADFAERVKEAKAVLREAETNLAAHQAECTAPQKPRKILDVRRPKPKPEPRRKLVEIDWEAMAAALATLPATAKSAGLNVLPVTGHCHECDRPVSGERRYCGPCMTRRKQ